MYCLPGIKSNSNKSCFDRPGLIRIINDYNQKYSNKKITYDQSLTDDNLWNLLRDQLADRCPTGDEFCWLDQDFLKHDETIQENYMLSSKPETQYKWLSTTNINKAMKVYENTNKDFAFMGAVPIDFDIMIEEYANINLCNLYHGLGLKLSDGQAPYDKRQIRRFGFIFNLDPHDKKGSHWVSMFMDLRPKSPYIGYFDSYGYCPPPKQITILMDRLKAQVKKCLGFNLIKKCNTIRHQHGHSECGVYSLYFIYNALLGKSFETITENIILDDDVNQYRDLFFRPTTKYLGNPKSKFLDPKLKQYIKTAGGTTYQPNKLKKLKSI